MTAGVVRHRARRHMPPALIFAASLVVGAGCYVLLVADGPIGVAATGLAVFHVAGLYFPWRTR